MVQEQIWRSMEGVRFHVPITLQTSLQSHDARELPPAARRRLRQQTRTAICRHLCEGQLAGLGHIPWSQSHTTQGRVLCVCAAGISARGAIHRGISGSIVRRGDIR